MLSTFFIGSPLNGDPAVASGASGSKNAGNTSADRAGSTRADQRLSSDFGARSSRSNSKKTASPNHQAEPSSISAEQKQEEKQQQQQRQHDPQTETARELYAVEGGLFVSVPVSCKCPPPTKQSHLFDAFPSVRNHSARIFSIAAGFGNAHRVFKPGTIKLHPELLGKH